MLLQALPFHCYHRVGRQSKKFLTFATAWIPHPSGNPASSSVLHSKNTKVLSLCSFVMEDIAALKSGVPYLFLPFTMLRKVSRLNRAVWSQMFWLVLPLIKFIFNILYKLFYSNKSINKNNLLLKFFIIIKILFFLQPREGKNE